MEATMPSCPFRPKESGQILVAVLLVMIISLTVGLAVSYRSLSSLRGSTYTTQSITAYHAAEAGVEEALNELESGEAVLTSCTSGSPCTASFAEADSGFGYYVERGGGTPDPYLLNLQQDETVELKLNGFAGSTLDFYWYVSANDPSGEHALLLTFVSGTGGDTITRYAYDNNYSANGNGFDDTVSAGTYSRTADGQTLDYSYYISSLSVPSTPQLLRLRAIYNDVTVVVDPSTNDLPAQSYVITATGTSAETQRTLEVTKGLPALPPIFDFAIFSGSTTQALTK